MNPETIDLSTWRDDTPPAELRTRLLRRPRSNALPRLGLAVVAAVGISAVLVIGSAPARAEALWQSAAARSNAGLVHYVEDLYIPSGERTEVHRSEVWASLGVKRTRVHRADLRVSQGAKERTEDAAPFAAEMISVTLGHGAPASPHRKQAVDLVQKVASEGGLVQDSPQAASGPLVGTFLIQRTEGKLTVERLSPLAFPNYAERFDSKSVAEQLGGADAMRVAEIDGNERVRLLQLTGSAPWRFRVAVDRASGRMVEASVEHQEDDRWVLQTRLQLEYPASLSADLFDPATLRG